MSFAACVRGGSRSMVASSKRTVVTVQGYLFMCRKRIGGRLAITSGLMMSLVRLLRAL